MPSPRAGSRAAAILAAMFGTVLFLWPWWNRYVALTLDGYLPLYGHLIRSGQVPYRDFFFHLPPLQALLLGEGVVAIPALSRFGLGLSALALCAAALRISQRRRRVPAP